MILALLISGVTAFPLESETRYLARLVPSIGGSVPGLVRWIALVHQGLAETGRRYPFIAYGTDWLAYAHLIIATAFWGPLRDPVRNIWVIQFGMLACAGVIPLALICGPIRGIPFGWTCLDMSFGVVGLLPLLLAYRHVRVLGRQQEPTTRDRVLSPPGTPSIDAAS